ncbi:hypothetical protein ZHAS_00001439 [Anopheles sinensis]|uniref:Uncharacterized protein n=1 Tax=Anopheles sinensis TaxID=74873 RepID=A0A084VBC1_ANOSI|nr:hypothetical protein ZHAS_00001439 [Anopheles sinensis]
MVRWSCRWLLNRETARKRIGSMVGSEFHQSKGELIRQDRRSCLRVHSPDITSRKTFRGTFSPEPSATGGQGKASEKSCHHHRHLRVRVRASKQ